MEVKRHGLGKLFRLLSVTVIGLGLAATSAHALSLTPNDADWTTDQNSNCDAACVSSLTGISGLTELYKMDVGGGSDSGPLAGSYTTTFQNTTTDPSGFTITYGTGTPASCPECILVVKDGSQVPAQYLFNLGDGLPFLWNGTEQIVGTGFWPNNGAISHVAIYGGTTSTSVPEPATLLLLGSGLLGLGAWARREKRGSRRTSGFMSKKIQTREGVKFMMLGNRVSRFFVGAAIIFTALFTTANPASAITLLFPDIDFDSTQGAGDDLFGSQGVSYDAGTGYLTVSAKATSITYDGVTSTALVDGTVDYRVDLTSSGASGGLVTGNFGTDGVAGSDLVISDISGTLLTGNFSYYQLNGLIGSNYGAGEAVFLVTGGSLASLYTSGEGGIVHLEFNMTPVFSATSFAGNFSGSVKGDIAPVAEPISILLLGSGLLGLGVVGRKLKKA